MSEYWVSKKKYFCKYCDTYIADDVPSRQQHESGLRHKGNMERFIRSLYKAGERRQKDQEEERREILRLEKAAQAAYAQDISSGNAKPHPSSTPPVPSTSRPAPRKPSSPWSNYSTPESLGYHNPDAEQSAADTRLRNAQGLVGQWHTVIPTPYPDKNRSQDDEGKVGIKRPAMAAEEDGPASKLRKKTVTTGLGEIYDPGIIPVKTKNPATQESESCEVPTNTPTQSSSSQPGWTQSHWQTVDPQSETECFKEEEILPSVAFVGDVELKLEAEQLESLSVMQPMPQNVAEGKSIFKKRRAPAIRRLV